MRSLQQLSLSYSLYGEDILFVIIAPHGRLASVPSRETGPNFVVCLVYNVKAISFCLCLIVTTPQVITMASLNLHTLLYVIF